MHLRRSLFLIITILCVSCVSHDLNKHVTCEKSDLHLELISSSPASNCSESDGEVEVVATGGEQPYFFHLNNETTQSESIFNNVNSGIHSITVTDKNGCLFTLSNIVIPAANFKFTADIHDDSECVNHNGSITIDVQEGTPPFTYTIQGGSPSENNSFEHLAPGTYAITIEDAAACTATLNITVQRVNTNTSWSADILPIIKANCAINGCHDGKTRIDYRLYTNAYSNAANMKLYTQNGSMPFGGSKLPQSQIDLITCWVDEGALEN